MGGTPDPERGTIAERIRVLRNDLAPAELSVANVLADSYPMAGLVPVIQLAEAAGVSAPTVLRFVNKLGFKGYSAFHKALRAEVQARLFSPVDAYPGQDRMQTSRARAQTAFLETIRSTFAHLEQHEIRCLGGRSGGRGPFGAGSRRPFQLRSCHPTRLLFIDTSRRRQDRGAEFRTTHGKHGGCRTENRRGSFRLPSISASHHRLGKRCSFARRISHRRNRPTPFSARPAG